MTTPPGFAMDSFVISSIDDFIKYVRDFCGSEHWGSIYVFRGQTQRTETWPLLPKAGRPQYFWYHLQDMHGDWEKPVKWDVLASYGYLSPYDMNVFSLWRRDAVSVTENLPENEWECLALAQHYGLATRLLDWTKIPWSLFFLHVKTFQIRMELSMCTYKAGFVLKKVLKK